MQIVCNIHLANAFQLIACDGTRFASGCAAAQFERQNFTMHLRLSLCLLTGLLALPLVDAQTPGPTPTVDELVAKNLEAKGGATALEAIKTIRFEGRLLVNQGQLELKYTETKKRPGKVRTDAVLQGMNLVQAYNGDERLENFPALWPERSGENVGRRIEVARRRGGNRRVRWTTGKQRAKP